jgi:hypothetical protein
MPYWLESTAAATPAFLWIYVGLGVPWALALLPRADWRDRPLVLVSGFAFGALLLTAWMFILGSVGALRFELILAGTLLLAGVGSGLAWRKRQPPDPHPRATLPLAFDEKLMIGLIAAALVIRWLGIAYWTFTAYDALWVYGYQGRLYTLLGEIPASIGYYPQFLPLQYAYAQLAIGSIDDHAARAVLVFTHIGSILAVYVLGRRLFNRRVGIFAAALWALYPHVAQWSRFGDLEIPLTFLVTLAAAFFLMAWTGQQPRRRYALLAGLVFGGALWTKPTAGGLVLGVLLLLLVELIRLRFDWRAWLPRFQLALITGLAAAPLGGAWYVRNVLLGHNAVDFPPPFWQTLAQRSGGEFGWLLVGLLLVLVYVYFGQKMRPDWRGGLMGILFVLAALLPSILMPRRMIWFEFVLLAVGLGILALTLWRHFRSDMTPTHPAVVSGAALLMALPFFVTWFWSYSYHYRLYFPIVPLLILPSALVLSCWLTRQRVQAWTRLRRWLYSGLIVALSLPGVTLALHDPNAGWDWLWSNELPDDFSRYASGNAALMNVVEGLQAYLDERDEPLVVVAPGVRQLPFFFPLEDIRTEETPTRFDQLDDVVYFIESSPEGRGAYESIPLHANQILSALDRLDVMRPAWGKDDGILRYQVYELYLSQRFVAPDIHVPPAGDIVFGGFARFLGHDISGADFWVGRKLFLNLYWEVLAQPTQNLSIYIHLRDSQDRVAAAWDAPVARSRDGLRYYSTLVWEPGEYIRDARTLRLEADAPLGEGYRLVIGMYDPLSGVRVPVTLDGNPAGDGYVLGEEISVVPIPPEELD